MEEKVIINLVEFERLKNIEQEIKGAFDRKELISLAFTQWGDRKNFKLVNESDIIKSLTDEIKRGKELADSFWAENIRLKNELEKKGKWWPF